MNKKIIFVFHFFAFVKNKNEKYLFRSEHFIEKSRFVVEKMDILITQINLIVNFQSFVLMLKKK